LHVITHGFKQQHPHNEGTRNYTYTVKLLNW